jgi:4-hydroxy-3-methylbut-2-enyl diphosphate reductase
MTMPSDPTSSPYDGSSHDVLLARPRGFCAGVERAVDIVDFALRMYGPPIYVRHEIVHNQYVVQDFEARGVVFIDEISEVPDDHLVIYSAHGIPPSVRQEAESRGLKTIDATCPLVTKVHHEALRYADEGYHILLVGHAGHVEVEGTMGHVPGNVTLVQTAEEAEKVEVPDPERVAFLTQTTLSVDDVSSILAVLARRFPAIVGPPKDDICYATQNRQVAVKAMASDVDAILVVGAPNSSNSNRLVEVARAAGVPAYLVQTRAEIRPEWLEGAERVGVTAGASAPEALVRDIVEALLGEDGSVEEMDVAPEMVHFPLPAEVVEDLQKDGRDPEELIRNFRQRWYNPAS